MKPLCHLIPRARWPQHQHLAGLDTLKSRHGRFTRKFLDWTTPTPQKTVSSVSRGEVFQRPSAAHKVTHRARLRLQLRIPVYACSTSHSAAENNAYFLMGTRVSMTWCSAAGFVLFEDRLYGSRNNGGVSGRVLVTLAFHIRILHTHPVYTGHHSGQFSTVMFSYCRCFFCRLCCGSTGDKFQFTSSFACSVKFSFFGGGLRNNQCIYMDNTAVKM